MNRHANHFQRSAMAATALAVLIVTGCAGDFEKRWSAALKTEPAEPILGCWDGTWHSKSTGHDGRLRMIVTKNDQNYHARFLAVYGGIFTFGTTIPLEPQRDGEITTFRSEHDLGWPWGNFTWEGRFAGDKFDADYDSTADKGTFKLKRPKPKSKPESTP